MRIGIDVRPLSRPFTGIARYVSSILGELAKIDTKNSYYLYSDRDFPWEFGIPRWRKRVAAWPRWLPGSLWVQTAGQRMILQDNLDTFWGPAHTLPLRLPANIRKVLTMHDVVWLRYPETMSFYNRQVTRLLAEKSVRQADQVVADSTATAADVQALLRVPASRIVVIYSGVSGHYHPHDHDRAVLYVAQRFEAQQDYICSVGTIEPRKNLLTLIEAFGMLRNRRQFQGQLLIAGGQGWGKTNIRRAMLKWGLGEKDVKLLGYVSEEEMPMLYSGAKAFVFPSLYEGFGLPLVEAMACGVAIVASNTSSIPEVVEDAALLVSPYDSEAMAAGILRLFNDTQLRAALIERGLRRAQGFTWEATARRVLHTLTGVAP
jgi:glycosyltransferase involved in cell wall biosynthesis